MPEPRDVAEDEVVLFLPIVKGQKFRLRDVAEFEPHSGYMRMMDGTFYQIKFGDDLNVPVVRHE